MIVYADILVCLNTIVTYFIILATKTLTKTKIKTLRIIISSLIGGASSLYIFLPQLPFLVEQLIKIVISTLITFVVCGRQKFKSLLRFNVIFFAVSFIYAGFMLGFWYVFKPTSMVINNGVVYFGISPIVLIFSTVICYFIILFGGKKLKRDNMFAEEKNIKIIFDGNEHLIKCTVDTGNNLSDSIGDYKVIILGIDTAIEIFGAQTTYNALSFMVEDGLKQRFRVLPFTTVGKNGIMPALRADSAYIEKEEVKKVLLAISKNNFDGDINGIISPDFIL